MNTAEMLGTGWRFPVRVGPRGRLELSSGEAGIQESIWLVLATAPGERVMRPRFGCGIHNYVFAPNTPTTHGILADEVRRALSEWEPRIDVLDVRVDAADDPALLLVRIDYRIRSTSATDNFVYPFYLRTAAGVV